MSDCRKPTTEEILEFLRQNYGPEWADESKLELGYTIWKKKFCSESKYSVQINGDSYVSKAISELEDGDYAEIRGIVIDRDKFTYLGCPICFKSVKKGCEHLSSGQTQAVKLTMTSAVVSDGTGKVSVTKVIRPEEDDPLEGIDNGDMVIVRGYVRVYPDVIKVYVNEADIIKKLEVEPVNDEQESATDTDNGIVAKIDEISNPNVSAFLRYLSSVGGMKVSVAKIMMERKGITMDDIMDYVDFSDDGTIITVKEGVV